MLPDFLDELLVIFGVHMSAVRDRALDSSHGVHLAGSEGLAAAPYHHGTRDGTCGRFGLAANRTVMKVRERPELDAASSEIHAATPVGWSVARPGRHREEHERPWHVTACHHRPAGKRHDIVEATGNTEAEALRDLTELLRDRLVERADDRAG